MRVGDYETIREIGRGGVGTVFAARGRDGRTVAIKLLRAIATDETRARFERERRLLAELGEEKGFVPLLDTGVSSFGAYVVMPLFTGGTLRDRLKRGQPFAVDEAVRVVGAIARALGHAHERGLVHRDVKPENVLFTAEGKPLVADLGLAKHWDGDAPGASRSFVLTTSGDFLGTVGYASPEQLEDTSKAGPPADVFALGAILYECLAAFPAFTGENVVELMGKVQECRPESVSRIAPATPPWLARIVSGALARDPERRFANGTAFARALAARGRAPHRGRLLGGGALGIAGLAILAAVLLARRSEVPRSGPPAVELEPLAPWFGGPVEVTCRARNATSARFTLLDGDPVAGPVEAAVVSGVARVRLEPRGSPGTVVVRVEVENGDEGRARAEETLPLLPRALADVARTRTLRLRRALGDLAFMHAGDVRRLALMADGGVAAVDTWGVVRVWDLETGTERRSWKADGPAFLAASLRDPSIVGPGAGGLAIYDASGHVVALEARGAVCAGWSPDGSLVATGGHEGIVVFTAQGQRHLVLKVASTTTALAFATDGQLLCAGSADGTFTLWSLAERRPLLVLEGGAMVHEIAISPDGKTAVVGRGNGSLSWVDLEKKLGGRIITEAHQGPLLSIAYAPDGKRLYTAGGDGRIGVWDGTRLVGALGGSAPILVTPDGRSVVAGGVNRVRVLDATTGAERSPRPGHRGSVVAVAPLTSGRIVSAGSDGAAIRWNAGGEPALMEPLEWAIGAIAVSPDERTLATVNVQRELRFRDVETLVRSPERLVLEDDPAGLSFDGRGRLWLGLRGGELLGFAYPPLGAASLPTSVEPAGLAAFWTDGERVLAWSRHGRVRFGPIAGRPEWVVPGSLGQALAVAPLHGRFALATEAGEVVVGSLERGTILARRVVQEGAIRCVAISPDGKTIVTGGADGTVRVLEATSLEEIDRLAFGSSLDVPNALAFGSGGHELLVGTMRGLVLRFSVGR